MIPKINYDKIFDINNCDDLDDNLFECLQISGEFKKICCNQVLKNNLIELDLNNMHDFRYFISHDEHMMILRYPKI